MKKVVSLLLVFTLLLSMSTTAFATERTDPIERVPLSQLERAAREVVVTDDGIYIDGVFHSQNEFKQMLESARELPVAPRGEYETQSAAAVVAGTWWIPGLGEVVITAAGAVVIAGAVFYAGSWIYNVVSNWFATRAFNKSAKNAVNGCDANKRNHIMQKKHNWNRHNNNPNWNNIAPILIKVLQDGVERYKGNGVYERSMVLNGYEVVVRFIKDEDGLVKAISTAFSK